MQNAFVDCANLSAVLGILLAEGKSVTTIEGLAENGEMSELQEAFVRHNAIQCGFCSPGMLMSAEYLLRQHPAPTEAEIRRGISGNLCRCTGYQQIVDAILEVAEQRKRRGETR